METSCNFRQWKLTLRESVALPHTEKCFVHTHIAIYDCCCRACMTSNDYDTLLLCMFICSNITDASLLLRIAHKTEIIINRFTWCAYMRSGMMCGYCDVWKILIASLLDSFTLLRFTCSTASSFTCAIFLCAPLFSQPNQAPVRPLQPSQ